MTGRVQRGIVKVGEEIEIVDSSDAEIDSYGSRDVPEVIRSGTSWR